MKEVRFHISRCISDSKDPSAVYVTFWKTGLHQISIQGWIFGRLFEEAFGVVKALLMLMIIRCLTSCTLACQPPVSSSSLVLKQTKSQYLFNGCDLDDDCQIKFCKRWQIQKYKWRKIQIQKSAPDNASSVWAGATMDNRRLARTVISGLLRFRRGGGWNGGSRGDIS